MTPAARPTHILASRFIDPPAVLSASVGCQQDGKLAEARPSYSASSGPASQRGRCSVKQSRAVVAMTGGKVVITLEVRPSSPGSRGAYNAQGQPVKTRRTVESACSGTRWRTGEPAD